MDIADQIFNVAVVAISVGIIGYMIGWQRGYSEASKRSRDLSSRLLALLLIRKDKEAANA